MLCFRVVNLQQHEILKVPNILKLMYIFVTAAYSNSVFVSSATNGKTLVNFLRFGGAVMICNPHVILLPLSVRQLYQNKYLPLQKIYCNLCTCIIDK